MADKYVIQRRTATGLEILAELPWLGNGKIDMSWLPVVGESGAAVIARGSNANGEWVRWEDGTQVCCGAPSHSFNTTDTTQVVTIIFPAAFANTNVCGSAYLYSYPGRRLMVSNYQPSATTLNICFYGMEGAPTSASLVSLRWLAIGRWK